MRRYTVIVPDADTTINVGTLYTAISEIMEAGASTHTVLFRLNEAEGAIEAVAHQRLGLTVEVEQ